MALLKKFFVFSAATIAAVYLTLWTIGAFGFRNPFSAFLINWLVMSWVAIAGQDIQISLPFKYYEFKAFERTGQVYERLGVRLFKTLVRRGPLAVFSPTLRFPQERTVPALQHLEQEMRKAETSHLLIFLIICIFGVYALVKGWLPAAGWLMLFNILINGYPIMLQRYNRIKLQALIQRQAA